MIIVEKYKKNHPLTNLMVKGWLADPKIYFKSKSNKEEEGSAANKEEKEFPNNQGNR